ncbi:hypothetical protein RIF29_08184 [Crotalaria pallida]|uniref:Uncharacterized protein n=1 Tax=Crotalaria pallida TaxID=3830 RepID=A0AAN9J529_CROPI
MGNCCEPASSMEWGGEDWDSLMTAENTVRKMSSSMKVFDESQGLSLGNVKKEKLLRALRSSCDANGKVTIKISKKELEELMGGIKNQNQMKKKQLGRPSTSSSEQVLFRLIKTKEHANQHHHDSHHHRPWRPALETIPEVK